MTKARHLHRHRYCRELQQLRRRIDDLSLNLDRLALLASALQLQSLHSPVGSDVTDAGEVLPRRQHELAQSEISGCVGNAHPADIKASLEKVGSSQSAIARLVTGRSGRKVTAGAVHQVIEGRSKSAAIAKRIAQVVGMPVSQLWPGAYPQIEAEEGARHG